MCYLLFTVYHTVASVQSCSRSLGGGGLLVFIDKRRYSVCGTYTPIRES